MLNSISTSDQKYNKIGTLDLNTFVHNKSEINMIVTWIKTPISKLSNGNQLMVSGDIGIGKSAIVNSALAYTKSNFQLLNEILGKIKDDKMLEKIYANCSNNNTIIVCDNIETITNLTEKKMLIKLSKIKGTVKIIYIANNVHSKTIIEIKKKAKTIKLSKPTKQEMLKIASQYIDASVEDKIALIEIVDNDIRQMINLCKLYQMIKHEYSVSEYIELVNKKAYNLQLFDTLNVLMHRDDLSLKEMMQYHDTDKIVITAMLIQNMCDSVNKTKYLSELAEIYDLFSKSDIVENIIFSEQLWDNHNLQSVYAIMMPLITFNNCQKIKKKIDYCIDFNKMSIKNINKKNINMVLNCINNTEFDDMLYMSSCMENPDFVRDFIDKYKTSKSIADIVKKTNKMHE